MTSSAHSLPLQNIRVSFFFFFSWHNSAHQMKGNIGLNRAGLRKRLSFASRSWGMIWDLSAEDGPSDSFRMLWANFIDLTGFSTRLKTPLPPFRKFNRMQFHRNTAGSSSVSHEGFPQASKLKLISIPPIKYCYQFSARRSLDPLHQSEYCRFLGCWLFVCRFPTSTSLVHKLKLSK